MLNDFLPCVGPLNPLFWELVIHHSLMAFHCRFITGKTPLLTPFFCILTFIIVLITPFLSILTLVVVMIVRPVLWLAALFDRHMARSSASTPQPPNPLPDQGLDEMIICSLPNVPYNAEADARLAECAICLMEFVDGDVTRVLPQCGHGFHVSCVDRWLRCHSSCPSCRRGVVGEEGCYK
ncbi:RING-H2 finger protein ATL80-like [Pyrus communis]|uniref:RING-H2 finger protein ATL80-like n=1 Tax=Pyrus communis TaxID=23211 RepID=UPI0035C0146E